MTDTNRRYDLILWGATGFTGQLIAEALLRTAPKTLKWALGGRTEAKLHEVRRALEAIDPAAAQLPVVVADASDEKSLDGLAASTRVVATTVGPFRVHGPKLVAAVARHGTHYCDLTGEAHFVRDMIDLHHAEAKRTGAKIVHCCGFDSIPSDLGVLMLQEHARAHFGRPLASIRFLTQRLSGGISGGTIASGLLLAEEAAKDPKVRKQLGNPYVLDPDREGRGPDGSDQTLPRWDPETRSFTAPFVMAAINTRIVRRSNALLGYAYGKDFRYSEAMGMRRGLKGAFTAATISAGLTGFMLAATTGPGRSLIRRFVPGPGEGPSREQQEKGHFHIKLIGEGQDRAGQPVRVVGHVKGNKDPGYGQTADMFSQAALGLAASDSMPGGGVLTPASAPGLGMHLVERLRKVGMTFEVEAS